jgi:hypothetical protein
MQIIDGISNALHSDWRRATEELAAVVAIVLAYAHAYHLRRQVRHLDEIRTWLPTQPIGVFPSYLHNIADLVKRARESIVIMCDYPAYGVFSDPDAYFNYSRELADKLHMRKLVSLTCLDDAWRTTGTRAEFSKHLPGWNRWRRKEVRNIRELLHRHNCDEARAATVTIDEIVELLRVDDARMLENTFLTADVKTVSDTLPLYFWLIDGKEAIFAIPSFSDRAIERGFFTHDPDLIAGLLDIHSRSLARENIAERPTT